MFVSFLYRGGSLDKDGHRSFMYDIEDSEFSVIGGIAFEDK